MDGPKMPNFGKSPRSASALLALIRTLMYMPSMPLGYMWPLMAAIAALGVKLKNRLPQICYNNCPSWALNPNDGAVFEEISV